MPSSHVTDISQGQKYAQSQFLFKNRWQNIPRYVCTIGYNQFHFVVSALNIHSSLYVNNNKLHNKSFSSTNGLHALPGAIEMNITNHFFPSNNSVRFFIFLRKNIIIFLSAEGFGFKLIWPEITVNLFGFHPFIPIHSKMCFAVLVRHIQRSTIF
jgi:hypothetical protein